MVAPSAFQSPQLLEAALSTVWPVVVLATESFQMVLVLQPFLWVLLAQGNDNAAEEFRGQLEGLGATIREADAGAIQSVHLATEEVAKCKTRVSESLRHAEQQLDSLRDELARRCTSIEEAPNSYDTGLETERSQLLQALRD